MDFVQFILEADIWIKIIVVMAIILVAIVLIVLLIPSGGKGKARKVSEKDLAAGRYNFQLDTKNGKIVFYNPFKGFLVYGGAGCGKTKSIGKPILREYIRHHFAGLVYDFKDFDLTRTTVHLCKKYDYPYKLYYLSFADMKRTHRTNVIDPKVIKDENLFIQLIADLYDALMGDEKKDTWYHGALGALKGIAYRLYKDYPEYCTIPHLACFVCTAGKERITDFVKGSDESRMLASAFIDSADSERTQASYLSTLTNTMSKVAFNKNVAYVLSGKDFEFNLVDPQAPKLVCVANSYQTESLISPIISLMVTASSRQFNLSNKIPFFYFLDEATTSKIADFEKMPSVLREYRCSFTFMTQSSAKITALYGEYARSSIEANLGNQFYGATKDEKALSTYQKVFGKIELERTSTSQSVSGSNNSRSTTKSTQQKDRYDTSFFKDLPTGVFVGSTSDASVKDFHAGFKMYDDEEAELPIVKPVFEVDIESNYIKIKEDISRL